MDLAGIDEVPEDDQILLAALGQEGLERSAAESGQHDRGRRPEQRSEPLARRRTDEDEHAGGREDAP